MKKFLTFFCICLIFLGLLFAAGQYAVFAQSQALNGQIEGTVQDQAGATVPNAVITARNVGTGAMRTVTTDGSGVYRFPLLPLGIYRISAEAVNFKKFIREGIILTTGQTATIDIELETGEVRETVTVSADSSIADAGKTDLGRVMNTREAQNLPLIPRNPYNFGLLQANVTGRPSRGTAFPSFNVNGYLRRVNYQFDGNTNTTYDRRIRFMLISDTFVSEVQLVTNGFAAEFGDTPGMILNIVTPSGTNKISGAVSYRFRRPPFYTRPFFYQAADLPDNKANIFTASVGAPIIKDRWHFYAAYEWQYRDDKAAAVRLLTITAENRAQLIAAGLSPSIFPPAIPSLERAASFIFRSDAQLNKYNRLTARINHFGGNSENFIQGGLNTLERSTDAYSNDYGLAVQLASYTPRFFNEFRFQYGQRRPEQKRNEFSGSGPSIVINQVANLGSPTTAGISSMLRITQFQNNLTRTNGSRIFKFGGGFSLHDYTEWAAVFSQYRFSSIANYIAARNGSPRTYSQYTESFGDPEIRYRATFWNLFAQDDWKITPRLKIIYGLRYDLYLVPKADADSLFPLSRKFNTDKNNFAPRLGVVYALREGTRPAVIRFGAGIYYDAPLLAIYRGVLQINGNPRFANYTFTPNFAYAPNFPNTFSGSLPSGAPLPRQNIATIAPDFETMYAMHFNFQFEQAITENLSLAVGYIHSAGRKITVYRNINPINPVRFLSDGRPVFGGELLDPRFGRILLAESGGVSRYDAMTLQLNQRFSGGIQFSANYTLSKATDDTPDGDIEGVFLTDPSNRNHDRGNSSSDQRHTFVMSLIARPQFNFSKKWQRFLFNDNQFAVITTANSGERFDITCGCDLNGDLFLDDRPIGIKRNAGNTPPQFNLDLRYSRFFNFTERYKLEVFGEFQNLFNLNSIVQFNDTMVETDTFTGELIGSLPDFKARNKNTAQESRQIQLGFKFIF